MSHTYTNLNYHLIFSTKDRQSIISQSNQPRIYAYIGGIINDLRGTTIAIGGVEDHVHILCRLKTDVSIAEALRQIKGGSSKWINEQHLVTGKFAWQTGYAAFSVSNSKTDNVKRYIEEQEVHHAKVSFQDELLEFLKLHDVEYDERYLWV